MRGIEEVRGLSKCMEWPDFVSLPVPSETHLEPIRRRYKKDKRALERLECDLEGLEKQDEAWDDKEFLGNLPHFKIVEARAQKKE